MSARTADDILRARARALARPVADEQAAASADGMDILVVMVDQQRLGIPLDRVSAIARAVHVVPLPRAVAPVYGVIAWRGRPLTVLVLGARTPEIGDASRFVVLGDSRRADVAVLVDAVDDAARVDSTMITESASPSRRVPAIGVTNDAVLIVDVQALIRGRRSETPATPIEQRMT